MTFYFQALITQPSNEKDASIDHPATAAKDRTTSATLNKGREVGESNAFLRQKEEQLRKRRSDEKKSEDTLPSQKELSTLPASTSAIERGSGCDSGRTTIAAASRLSNSADHPAATLRGGGVRIPQFYFPHGRPPSKEETDATYKGIKEVFGKLEGGRATKANMAGLAKVKKCKSLQQLNFMFLCPPCPWSEGDTPSC